MKGVYAVTPSSASTTYGNVMCIIREMLLQVFNPSFFTYVNISSELPFRNIRRQFTKEPTQEMSKRVKPYMVIRPGYESPSDDIFMRNTPMTRNFDNMEYFIDDRFLRTIVKDDERGYALQYKVNRDRIDFEVTITLESLHQMIDIRNVLDNLLSWDQPFTHTGALEALIPRNVIRYYGKLLGMDIDDPTANVAPMLLRRINQFSKYPINYKMKNASSRDEFFMYYTHNLVVFFSDLSSSAGNKTGMIDDNFEITFRGWVEFFLPGLYVLQDFYGTKMERIDLSLTSSGEYPSSGVDEIPIFTVTNFYNDFPPMKNGMNLFVSTIFRTDKYPGTTKDFLNMTELFSDEETNIIKRNSMFRQNVDRLFKVYILKDNTLLKENEDFFVNWNLLGIIFNEVDKYATYRLIIYADRERINDEHMEDIYEQSTDLPDIIHDNANERVWGNLVSTLVGNQYNYQEYYDDSTIELLWYDGEEIYGILNNINIAANEEIHDLSIFD